MIEEKVQVPSSEAPSPALEEIERQRRHLWATTFIVLVLISLVVVVMSYWTEVVPEVLRDFLEFPGYRFVFLLVSIAFIVYATQRERNFRGLTDRYIREHEQNVILQTQLAEEQIAKERLAENDRLRADFVANITHELKTPLTSLLGYAAILRKRSDTLSPEQREEYVAVLERQGQRILQLIEELLQKSRIEAGIAKLQRVPLQLQVICTQVAREISLGRGRQILVDVPDADLGLFGDPAAIEHVVTNLIDNALKYSPEDRPVRVSIVESEGEIHLLVSDEGSGIDSEDLPFIFERFRQSGNARGRASVGLGLYIVKNLVTAHGGRVWAESDLDKGTTFTVALPRRRD